MKPDRVKRLFKAYLGIGFLFMLIVCIGIVFFVMSIRGGLRILIIILYSPPYTPPVQYS